jgi:uncharacterized protein
VRAPPDIRLPVEHVCGAVAGMTGDLRTTLRLELSRALKARDRTALAACRTALAAVDNAEAVPLRPGEPRAGALEQSVVGVGAADVARRELTEREVREVVVAEFRDLRSSADHFTVSHPERAHELRTQAEVMDRLLGG